jgi:hypothetical protein
MSRRFTYGIAPGYGEKNAMAAEDTIEITIGVNKDEIYDDARVMLHKFGDARLTAENDYHIHVVQADDMDEDTMLFERSYARAFRDAVTACMAYYPIAASNKTGYIDIIPPEVHFGADDKNSRPLTVEASGRWRLFFDGLQNHAHQMDSVNDTDFLYAINLLMPTTWRKEIYESLCDNVYDFILFSIVADFLKLTEPREYGFYKEEAQKYRIWIKDALEMRNPFTRYTEIKPF